jgi:hypothetical protein
MLGNILNKDGQRVIDRLNRYTEKELSQLYHDYYDEKDSIVIKVGEEKFVLPK